MPLNLLFAVSVLVVAACNNADRTGEAVMADPTRVVTAAGVRLTIESARLAAGSCSIWRMTY
jgi:hypothetical protein